MSLEIWEETADDPPDGVIPVELAQTAIDMVATLETASIKEKKDRVITALALADWYTQNTTFSLKLHRDLITGYFHTDLDQAYEESKKILLALKSEFAVNVTFPNFTIDDKIFLHVGVPGKTKESAQATWHPYFDSIFQELSITDADEQYELRFSGLGDRSLELCIIMYEMDWTPSFVYHEWLHVAYPGFTNAFFDEMVTETLAYLKCDLIDPQTFTMRYSSDALKSRQVNVDYYDAHVYFLALCREIPGLFVRLETLYKAGDNDGLQTMADSIGKDRFDELFSSDPSRPI